MPIIIDCPSCQRKLRVGEEFLGKLVQCPTCSTRFTATGEVTPPVAPLSTAPLEITSSAPPSTASREPELPATAGYAEEEDDERPWEQPGGIRRDAESHRGTLVLTLGIIGLVLSILGIPLMFCALCCPLGLVGSLLSLPLTIMAWVMGHGDLRKMRNNLMDPRGQGQTRAGWICGIIGTILGIISTLVTAVWWIFILVANAAGTVGAPPPPANPPPPKSPPPPSPPPKRKKISLHDRVPMKVVDYLPAGRW